MPTPHTVWPPIDASTYAAACASSPDAIRVLGVVQHRHVEPDCADGIDEGRERSVACADDLALDAVDQHRRGDLVRPTVDLGGVDLLPHPLQWAGSVPGTPRRRRPTSPSETPRHPSPSVIFCTAWLNSICRRRRQHQTVVGLHDVGPRRPLPDCEFTRITASYVRPTSFGSIGR